MLTGNPLKFPLTAKCLALQKVHVSFAQTGASTIGSLVLSVQTNSPSPITGLFSLLRICSLSRTSREHLLSCMIFSGAWLSMLTDVCKNNELNMTGRMTAKLHWRLCKQ